MNVVTLTKENFDDIVDQAATVIKNGGVVVTPSETQYGLCTDPSNEQAVDKVYAIKGRDFNNPLGLIAGNMDMIHTYFLVNETEKTLMNTFWPGPLGLQLRITDDFLIQKITKLTRRDSYDENHPEANKKVIRISSNDVLRTLAEKIGWPVISTSANISGQPGCYDTSSVIAQLEQQEIQPDLIIDAGELSQTPPSTMIDATQKPHQIIRKGADFEEVEKIIKQVESGHRGSFVVQSFENNKTKSKKNQENKEMNCVFCNTEIIRKEVVLDLNNFIILVNTKPNNNKDHHFLIIPKQHRKNLPDFSVEEIGELGTALRIFETTLHKIGHTRIWWNTGERSGRTIEHFHIHGKVFHDKLYFSNHKIDLSDEDRDRWIEDFTKEY